jgi:tRNA (cmo5U34)-methyltransferase
LATNRVDGSETSLGHMPQGSRWEFDESVTAVFGDMLQRSIPEYDALRRCVFDLGCAAALPGATIVDLGCSRGDGLAPFVQLLGSRSKYHGVELSEPMLAAARGRFKSEIESGFVTIEPMDLRTGYPSVRAGLTLCVLTLQFIPIEHRQRVMSEIYDSTLPGGALLLVEKVLGASATIDSKMVDLYYRRKKSNGYTAEEVERKKLALEGVLVPVTARWNEDLMRGAGFRSVDCFWRWMNFAGWIAIK